MVLNNNFDYLFNLYLSSNLKRGNLKSNRFFSHVFSKRDFYKFFYDYLVENNFLWLNKMNFFVYFCFHSYFVYIVFKENYSIRTFKNLNLLFIKQSDLIFFSSKKFLIRFVNIIKQVIFGIVFGFRGEIELRGLGFRGFINNNSNLFLDLGGGHWVFCPKVKGLSIKFFGNYHILIKSLDLLILKNFMFLLESLYFVNVYTGMGLRNSDSLYRVKIGKVREGN